MAEPGGGIPPAAARARGGWLGSGRCRQLPRLLVLAGALLLPLVVVGSFFSPAQPPPGPGKERLSVGFTFSRRQAEYLGLSWHETFLATAVLSPNIIRLGAYWDEIERQPGRYDFSSLDWLLAQSEARHVSVILTVGMKAPRWPEYYLPSWLESGLQLPDGAQVSDDARLQRATLDFITRVVERYKGRDVVKYWQVENEPLDAAGRHHWRIGVDFLQREVELVRRLDERKRPVIVNMFVDSSPLVRLPPWNDELHARATTILGLADILGLDVYPSRGLRVLGHDLYFNWSGWEQPVRELQARAQLAGKPAWIIEAQAEPWEPRRVVYTDPAESRSVRPSTAASTFERLESAGFPTILFWGVEHWYMRWELYKDASWWNLLGPFLGGSAHAPVQANPAATGGALRPLPPDP